MGDRQSRTQSDPCPKVSGPYIVATVDGRLDLVHGPESTATSGSPPTCVAFPPCTRAEGSSRVIAVTVTTTSGLAPSIFDVQPTQIDCSDPQWDTDDCQRCVEFLVSEFDVEPTNGLQQCESE